MYKCIYEYATKGMDIEIPIQLIGRKTLQLAVIHVSFELHTFLLVNECYFKVDKEHYTYMYIYMYTTCTCTCMYINIVIYVKTCMNNTFLMNVHVHV